MALKVSVIIPVHNAVNTLKYAVQSALPADRVFLINDASDDGSAELVWQLARQYNHVIRLETGSDVPAGVCHARNLGITRADDDSLIIPLDADDMLLPNAIHHYASIAGAGACTYGGWVELDVINNRRREVAAPPPVAIESQDIARGICFHRSDWARVGGYDPAFNLGGEDYAFMLALMRAGVELVRLPQTLYQYTIGAHTRKDNTRARWDCVEYLLEERHGRVHQSHSKI